MSATYPGIDGYVGNTPLIRLRRLSELTGCEILGKAEFMNPGGSVKDRAAYGIITDAEKAGHLRPGATIVEGTAGEHRNRPYCDRTGEGISHCDCDSE